MKRQYKKTLIPILKETPKVMCKSCGSTRFNKDNIIIHTSWNNNKCFKTPYPHKEFVSKIEKEKFDLNLNKIIKIKNWDFDTKLFKSYEYSYSNNEIKETVKEVFDNEEFKEIMERLSTK